MIYDMIYDIRLKRIHIIYIYIYVSMNDVLYLFFKEDPGEPTAESGGARQSRPFRGSILKMASRKSMGSCQLGPPKLDPLKVSRDLGKS